jgi:hypothetical protein
MSTPPNTSHDSKKDSGSRTYTSLLDVNGKHSYGKLCVLEVRSWFDSYTDNSQVLLILPSGKPKTPTVLDPAVTKMHGQLLQTPAVLTKAKQAGMTTDRAAMDRSRKPNGRFDFGAGTCDALREFVTDSLFCY